MSKAKTNNNTLHLPKEKLWVNPKVFNLVTDDDIKGLFQMKLTKLALKRFMAI